MLLCLAFLQEPNPCVFLFDTNHSLSWCWKRTSLTKNPFCFSLKFANNQVLLLLNTWDKAINIHITPKKSSVILYDFGKKWKLIYVIEFLFSLLHTLSWISNTASKGQRYKLCEVIMEWMGRSTVRLSGRMWWLDSQSWGHLWRLWFCCLGFFL